MGITLPVPSFPTSIILPLELSALDIYTNTLSFHDVANRLSPRLDGTCWNKLGDISLALSISSKAEKISVLKLLIFSELLAEEDRVAKDSNNIRRASSGFSSLMVRADCSLVWFSETSAAIALSSWLPIPGTGKVGRKVILATIAATIATITNNITNICFFFNNGLL